jgi:hypothetical protein
MRQARLKAVGCRSESDLKSRVRDFLPTAYSLRPTACAIALAIALSGCAIEPWVKPYERAALADPIMAASRDAVAAEYLHHVHEVREGARGASGSAGGGCGCN